MLKGGNLSISPWITLFPYRIVPHRQFQKSQATLPQTKGPNLGTYLDPYHFKQSCISIFSLFMANLDSELQHNQFKHNILAGWIKNNKNKFRRACIGFPHMHLFLFFHQNVHWNNSMNNIREKYACVPHWRWRGKYDQSWYFCEQSILYLGSTHIVEENEQDIKSCKCRLWSLMQSNDDKPIPWDHADLLTASHLLSHLLE